jgi:uncharacterized protein (DUF2267 family)
MNKITGLEKTIHKTYDWIYNIEENAGWDEGNELRSLSALRAVLHELRDNLMINDLAHFSAQLPLLIRGMLFEAWNPDHTPLKERKKEDFLFGVFDKLPDAHKNVDIEIIVQAVFATIQNKIDPAEFEKLKKLISKGVRSLMP